MTLATRVPRQDSLHFAVFEALKNMLLVMQASGVFDQERSSTAKEFSLLTWELIDSFCPELRNSLPATQKNQNQDSSTRVQQTPSRDHDQTLNHDHLSHRGPGVSTSQAEEL